MSIKDKINKVFEEKKKFNQQSLSMPYLEAAWNLMIAAGGALNLNYNEEDEEDYRYQYNLGFNYLGAQLDISSDATSVIFEELNEYGIDYENSTDPSKHIGEGFNGTFTDTQLKIYGLIGVVALNNDKKYWWGVNVDEEFDFGSLIQKLVEETTFEEAMEYLSERLTAKKYKDLFKYTCKLPLINLEKYA